MSHSKRYKGYKITFNPSFQVVGLEERGMKMRLFASAEACKAPMSDPGNLPYGVTEVFGHIGKNGRAFLVSTKSPEYRPGLPSVGFAYIPRRAVEGNDDVSREYWARGRIHRELTGMIVPKVELWYWLDITDESDPTRVVWPVDEHFAGTSKADMELTARNVIDADLARLSVRMSKMVRSWMFRFMFKVSRAFPPQP